MSAEYNGVRDSRSACFIGAMRSLNDSSMHTLCGLGFMQTGVCLEPIMPCKRMYVRLCAAAVMAILLVTLGMRCLQVNIFWTDTMLFILVLSTLYHHCWPVIPCWKYSTSMCNAKHHWHAPHWSLCRVFVTCHGFSRTLHSAECTGQC